MVSMDDNVETFVSRRRYKVACKEVVSRFVDLILVSALNIALTKTGFADCIRHIEEVQLMHDFGVDKQGSHPGAPDFRVGGKIEHN